MAWKKILIRFGGEWEGLEYNGGEEEVLLVPPTGMCYSELLKNIYDIILVDSSEYIYILYSLVDVAENKLGKVKIKNNCDVDYLLECLNEIVIFVSLKKLNTRSGDVLLGVSDVGVSGTGVSGCGSVGVSGCGGVSVDRGDGNRDDDNDDDGDGDKFFDNDSHRKQFEEFSDYFEIRGGFVGGEWNNTTSKHKNIHIDHESNINVPAESRWNIPGIPAYVSAPLIEIVPPSTSNGSLQLGATYMTKSDMLSAVGAYHIVNRTEYRVFRSDRIRYCAICKHDGCPFIVQGNGRGDVWRVWKLIDHTCKLDLNCNAPRQRPSKVISACLAPNLLLENTELVPRQMMAKLHTKYSLPVRYNLALKSKYHAIAMIYGDANESFKMFPSYLHMLAKINPGSFSAYKVDNRKIFKYAFYALSASIRGFAYSRPVIVVDGMHLKGKYRGILFVAVTKDGNNQIFPLAVGIGDVENEESWTWFMEQLKTAYGCPDQLLIVSDGHQSIRLAMEAVFPQAAHGLCCNNLQNNLAKYGQHVVAMFNNAAYSYLAEDYEIYYSCIALTNKGAADDLTRIGVHKWARSQCKVRRFDFMNSNAVESFNNRLMWARKLSVCSVLEVARTTIEKWFYERHTAAESRTELLTEYASLKLLKAIQQGSTMNVECLSTWIFKVRDGIKIYIVDLEIRTCTCQEFQHDLMPCSHAAAAIRSVNHDQLAYVADYYKTSTLRRMWSGNVIPIPDPTDWVLPAWVKREVCDPPMNPKQVGRPKRRRHPSGAESSNRSRKSQVYSKYGLIGHHCK